MERIQKDLETHIRPVRLFIDDVLQCCELMSQNQRELDIRFDDWKLSNTREIGDFAARHAVARELVLRSTPPGRLTSSIYLSISQGGAFVTTHSPTPDAVGIFHVLVDILRKCVLTDAKAEWSKEQWDTIVLSQRPHEIKHPRGEVAARATVLVTIPPNQSLQLPEPPRAVSAQKTASTTVRVFTWIWEATNHQVVGFLFLILVGGAIVTSCHYNIFSLSRTGPENAVPTTAP